MRLSDTAPTADGPTADGPARPAARAQLSTPRIVFLVIAAAAPLASLIGNLPIALARGNGVGTPGAFVIAGAILLCFAVGYAAMSRRIVNTGAFYTYITEGLGTAAGIGSAYVAVVAYLAFTFGLAAFFGYFTDLVLGAAGVHLPWPLYAAVGVAAVALFGYRSADLSAKVLGALMIGEVAILAVFDVSVIAVKGLAASLPAAAVAPAAVFTPTLGVSLMIAFTCFLGFESAALYGEEAAEPKRSIPIATYTAVIVIAVFYLFTAWVTVGAILPDDIAARADRESGELMFNVFTRYGGEVLADIMGVLVCLSLLASYVAIHNAAARYVFALGREWLLPPWFGESNPRSGAPSRASLTISALTVLAVVPFALTGLDPFKAGAPVLIGFGSFGVIFLQAFAAVAIVAYLARHARSQEGGEPLWVTLASWLGMVGLVAATAFVAVYFRLLAINESLLVAVLPLFYPLVVAVCFAVAGIVRLIHVDRSSPWMDARAQAVLRARGALAAEGEQARAAGGGFALRLDAAATAFVVRYESAAGRVVASEAEPTLDAARRRAADLRDRRGATVLEIVGPQPAASR